MLRVTSSALEVDVLPDVGGKIGQIRDRVSGREFLVSPQKPYRTIPAGESWLDYDTSGMDDCFPNIAAGLYPSEPWTGLRLPDLGEWTHGCWDVQSADPVAVVLQRRGELLPVDARKSVCLVGDRTVELAYRITNIGEFPLPYMWSAHPLISVSEAFEIRLPEGDMVFRTFPADGKEYAWPFYGFTDLSHNWVRSGTDLKIFVTGMQEGWCELRLPDHTLRFTFDPWEIPVVGMWFNNFGFPSGGAPAFRCIAIEPCTSPSDLLDELPSPAYRVLGRSVSAEWSLRLAVLPKLQ